MNKNSQNPTEQMQADTAQAHQEPVAWMYEWNGRTHITTADQRPIEHAHPHFKKSKPLYTAPQPPAVDQQFDTWSHDDGDSWYDNPGDAEIIQSCLGRDAKIGDEYELWASIDAVTLRYRIVAQHGDDFEVECISQPQQKTAPRLPAAQQEPVAWRVRPFDYGIGYEGVDALTTRKEQCEMWERKGWKVEPLYAAPQPTENLRCKSTQKRLATLWGYVKKEPDHFRDATQIVSVSQMLEVLRTKYSDLIYESNQKMAVHFEEDIFTINDFLQRIQQEAAEAI